MVSDDVTPGEISLVPCPLCGGPVQFTMMGGPHHLVCRVCGAVIALDVVHDGNRWTIRRVRQGVDPPSANPP